MTTAAGYFDRKASSSIRPGLAHLQADPSSPHTPQRTFSSAFSSPSISYRNEEEPLIFDFGSRHFSAGFAGETTPRCTLGFGPEESRRVGDYRKWLPGYKKTLTRKSEDEWGREHELWRMDLREVDLGLVEDKIERAVREACNQYLLLDVKTRRILLILPSVLPHQLLSSILTTIFVNLQNPSITLFSTPTVHTVAAGCRSSLVVDIGWSETTVTAIYEYREVHQSRTTRAMKRVTVEMVKMLRKHSEQSSSKDERKDDEKENMLEADFDIAEDITTRMAWCPTIEEPQRMAQQQQEDRSTTTANPSSPPPSQALSHLTIASDAPSPPPPPPADPQITVPSPFPSPSSKHPSTITLPFTHFAHPTQSALLATHLPRHTSDDHEQPLPSLLYRTLLSIPPDVRAICVSHIILTGGGSRIPGLKSRLLEELSATVQERGWDAVEGRAAAERRTRAARKKLGAVSGNLGAAAPSTVTVTTTAEEEQKGQEKDKKVAPKPEPLPASHQLHPPDPIAEKLHKAATRGTKPIVSGVVRGVESLGAWAGGSLMASLRIKGVVEVDRDVFLSTGLAGARKGGGLEAGKLGWTLGGWG